MDNSTLSIAATIYSYYRGTTVYELFQRAAVLPYLNVQELLLNMNNATTKVIELLRSVAAPSRVAIINVTTEVTELFCSVAGPLRVHINNVTADVIELLRSVVVPWFAERFEAMETMLSTTSLSPEAASVIGLLRVAVVLWFVYETYRLAEWLLNEISALVGIGCGYLALYIDAAGAIVRYACADTVLVFVALLSPPNTTFGNATLAVYLLLVATYYHHHQAAILFRPLRWANHADEWVNARQGPTYIKKLYTNALRFMRYRMLCLTGYIVFFCVLPACTAMLLEAMPDTDVVAALLRLPNDPNCPVVVDAVNRLALANKTVSYLRSVLAR
ncbi:hypothetical protein DPSP01_012132 [Paraphaeosphaeria sporulosa]